MTEWEDRLSLVADAITEETEESNCIENCNQVQNFIESRMIYFV